MIDESHVTLPQVHGMREGDRSRKKSLIDYGFRLPSAFDNRPLSFDEFESKFLRTRPAIFVSATPDEYEKQHSSVVVEQLVRPTGVVDPQIVLRPIEGQADDLRREIEERARRNERTLVTTLTKRMAEDLTDYLVRHDIRARYLHADIDTTARSELIRGLRLGKVDALVGIDLLREGLDLPEVSLVCVLDADKPGFLRNTTSLIQTIGRAARNTNGKAIFYGDVLTPAMTQAIAETNRRREHQIAYNTAHGITPRTAVRKIAEAESDVALAIDSRSIPKAGLHAAIVEAETAMQQAAEELDFERAIQLRERIKELRKRAQESQEK